jgi:hypothetical protein
MSRNPLWVLACLVPSAFAAASDYKLEPVKEALPTEVAAPLREALTTQGWRVVGPKGKPLVDLWFRKEAPPAPGANEPGVKLEGIAEGTFLGVARYHQKHIDYKNKPIPPGAYTIRNGIQPRDGDHLGVSDTRDFAILCALSDDKELAPLSTKELVKKSSQVSGTKHPVVVWLRPMTGEQKELPALVAQEDREYQIVEFRIALQGEKDKSVRAGLVVVGSAPEV